MTGEFYITLVTSSTDKCVTSKKESLCTQIEAKNSFKLLMVHFVSYGAPSFSNVFGFHCHLKLSY